MSDDIQRAVVLIWAFWVALLPSDSMCDRIILKDGTIETTERVWESEKYIHFILDGTQSVEVRYAKEIVARIEKKEPDPGTGPTTPLTGATGVKKQATPNRMAAPQQTLPSNVQMPSNQEKAEVAAEITSEITIDRSILDGIRNTSFYDPHRPKRYWASRNSRHDSLRAAIEALAGIYGKPKQWVETNMGEENDLGLIHSRLLAARDSEVKQGIDPEASPKIEQPVFGDENIAKAPAQESEKPEPSTAVGDWPPLDFPADLHFYEPRREKRYWIHPRSHFDTLQEALNALAAQYGVTSEWIESHMGETNTLQAIHKNIRESLTRR